MKDYENAEGIRDRCIHPAPGQHRDTPDQQAVKGQRSDVPDDPGPC
jgi:hypothetical protein